MADYYICSECEEDFDTPAFTRRGGQKESVCPFCGCSNVEQYKARDYEPQMTKQEGGEVSW